MPAWTVCGPSARAAPWRVSDGIRPACARRDGHLLRRNCLPVQLHDGAVRVDTGAAIVVLGGPRHRRRVGGHIARLRGYQGQDGLDGLPHHQPKAQQIVPVCSHHHAAVIGSLYRYVVIPVRLTAGECVRRDSRLIGSGVFVVGQRVPLTIELRPHLGNRHALHLPRLEFAAVPEILPLSALGVDDDDRKDGGQPD